MEHFERLGLPELDQCCIVFKFLFAQTEGLKAWYFWVQLVQMEFGLENALALVELRRVKNFLVGQ